MTAPPIDDRAQLIEAITRQVVQEATGRTSELGPPTTTGTDGRFDLQTHRGLSGPGTRWWWDGQVSRPSVLVDDPRCAALLVECTDEDVTDCDVGTLRVPQGGLVSGSTAMWKILAFATSASRIWGKSSNRTSRRARRRSAR